MEITASEFLLAGQLLILAFQLYLAFKVHFFEKAKNKPYFSIISNWPALPEAKSRFKYDHNLKNNLIFEAKGDSLICVCGSSLYVNGVCKDPDCIPSRMFFEPNSDFSILSVPLELNEKELEREKVDVILTLKLRNQDQYKYKQTFYMTFEKNTNTVTDMWALANFNLDISKGH